MAVMPASAPAAEDGRLLLGPGDRIELAIAGLPELGRTVTIDADGYVMLPFLGSVQVAGRTTEDLRADLALRLPQFAFSRWAHDGTEYQIVIEAEAITFQVAEYRPIYVEGHVNHPGEQPFRPGLTARQALARAGGDDTRQFFNFDPALLAAELRGEVQDIRQELVRLDAARARVSVELGERAHLLPDSAVLGASGSDAQRVWENAGAELRAREDRLFRDRASLEEQRALVGQRLGRLRDAFEREQAVVEADRENEGRVRESSDRGLIRFRDVAEAQRLALSSAARAETVAAEIAGVERELEALRRLETRLVDDHRIGLIEEASALDARKATLRARLHSAVEKLTYVSGRDPGALGVDSSLLHVRIARVADRYPTLFEADLDTRLLPGDVVSFTFPAAILDLIMGRGAVRAGQGILPDGGAGFRQLPPAGSNSLAAGLPGENSRTRR